MVEKLVAQTEELHDFMVSRMAEWKAKREDIGYLG